LWVAARGRVEATTGESFLYVVVSSDHHGLWSINGSEVGVHTGKAHQKLCIFGLEASLDLHMDSANVNILMLMDLP